MAGGSAFEIRGAEEFAKVAKDCRAAGRKDLQVELRKGLNRATKPMKLAAKAGALATLPQRGGLAGRVAGSRITTRARAGKNPSIRLVGKEGRKSVDLDALDRGRLRHPVFGNRKVWVQQKVPDGWWSESLEKTAPEARRDITKAVDAVARKLEHG